MAFYAEIIFDKDYKAAIYLRLSKEDGDFSISGEKLESDSISNQRMLIKEYLKKHPEITVVKEYCDDGFTGANFERPDFNRMMEAVRAGLVDCIVVKDLSRFGREYIEAGDYIQKIFPASVFALLQSTTTMIAHSPERQTTSLSFRSRT